MSIQVKKTEEKSRILGFAIAQELNVEEIESVSGGKRSIFDNGETDPSDQYGMGGINDSWSNSGDFKIIDDKN